jgi:hypothetical protein
MTNLQRQFYSQKSGNLFDPLEYVKQLENVGFSRDQAELQAETFLSIVQEKSATQHHIKELETELKQDIEELRTELKHGIKEVRNEMNHMEVRLESKMSQMEFKTELLRRDLKIWFGGMLVTMIATTSTAVTLVPYLMR